MTSSHSLNDPHAALGRKWTTSSYYAAEDATSDNNHYLGMEAAAAKESRFLSSEQIEEFHRRGVLVIRNFLSADEVHEARKGK